MLARGRRFEIPLNSIYLNVAPYGTPAPRSFTWLNGRTDIKPVFFIHDLLPIDRPEFFPRDWQRSFENTVASVATRAAGVLVASETMKLRVVAEMKGRFRRSPLIHVCGLPPSFAASPGESHFQLKTPTTPYFVVCGTIEPRKNHLLLLDLWIDLLKKGLPVPRLIVVGGRGWKNQRVFDLLDHCPLLRGHVLEVAGISDSAKMWLLKNANGSLVPSFDEGYGFPLVEALSLGLPTIASDIPIFREVGKGYPTYCNPADREAWSNAILGLADRTSAFWISEAQRASAFRSPSWSSYFESVMKFLSVL